jgi:hypothetical protein
MFRTLLIMFAAVTAFSSCNLDEHRLSDEEKAGLAATHADSVAIEFDSLNKIQVAVLPLYDKQSFDSNATQKFFDLARETNGELKILVNSALLSIEMRRIIKSNVGNNTDLLFLIDKTSSMEDDIDIIRSGMTKLMKEISAFENVHLGIGLYGDKNEDGEEWFSFKDFGGNYYEAIDYLNGIQVTGGGDWPESVYDAFFEVDKHDFWRSGTKRMVLLIGDAGPLEKPQSDYSIVTNFYPIVVTPTAGLEGYPEVKEYKEARLISNLFPNPVKDLVTVTFNQADDYTIYLHDATGKELFSEKCTAAEWKKDLGSYPSGAYIFRAVTSRNTYESRKIIIQH